MVERVSGKTSAHSRVDPVQAKTVKNEQASDKLVARWNPVREPRDLYGVGERRIARLLSPFPQLKAWVKQRYAKTVYYLSGGQGAAVCSRSPIHEIGPPGVETFFGYYDKCPLSARGWLLCHASPYPSHRPPRAGQRIEIQVYDFRTKDYRRPVLSVDTACFNWQQGARAQWLDDDHFIFNDLDLGQKQYISRVYSVSQRRETARYKHAVQDSSSRNYLLSINYRRLQALRPDYGYCSLPALDEHALARLEDDGVWHVAQDTGEDRLIYSLRDVCQVAPDPGFAQARHKVNHAMISPSGEQFIFLHRYFIGRRKFDRLMLGTPRGSDLRILSSNGMVSHCFWVDDTALLCFMRGPGGRDGYYLVDTQTGQTDSLFDTALDCMGDGHPHVRGDWFITDTYPDKRRMQHLIRCNLRTGEIAELGRFHQSFRYGGATRCDLHPRVSPDGRHVFFDSVCNGKRRLYSMDLQEEC